MHEKKAQAAIVIPVWLPAGKYTREQAKRADGIKCACRRHGIWLYQVWDKAGARTMLGWTEMEAGRFVKVRKGRQGVGSAYKEGILKAFDDGADLVLQFDFGQSLSTALDVLRVAGDLYDIEGWRDFMVRCQRRHLRLTRSVARATLTRIGTWLFNGLLPLAQVQDASCGMRVWSRGLIELIPWVRIGATGYFFNLETLFYAMEVAQHTYVMHIVENLDNPSHLRGRDVLQAFVDFLKLWNREGRRWTRPKSSSF